MNHYGLNEKNVYINIRNEINSRLLRIKDTGVFDFMKTITSSRIYRAFEDECNVLKYTMYS